MTQLWPSSGQGPAKTQLWPSPGQGPAKTQLCPSPGPGPAKTQLWPSSGQSPAKTQLWLLVLLASPGPGLASIWCDPSLQDCPGWAGPQGFSHKEGKSVACSRDQFQCGDGDCISSSYRCDGVSYNCRDNTDEVNCPAKEPIGIFGKALKAFKNTFSTSSSKDSGSKNSGKSKVSLDNRSVQTLGRGWRKDAENTTEASLEWTGQCVVDSSDRVLPDFEIRSGYATPAWCNCQCKQHGHRYAGVEAQHWCYCGDSEPPASALYDGSFNDGDADCDLSCGGDSEQTCGGFWRMNVYDTQLSDEECSCHPQKEFECDDGQCIGIHLRCNHNNDCTGPSINGSVASDERDCTTYCSSSQFLCDNDNCINKNYVCDNDNDCGDRSDERNCDGSDSDPVPETRPSAPRPTCSRRDKFLCNSGECINLNYRCDGDNDCSDRSDEADCATTCTSSRFHCDNGKCINGDYRCDNDNDCGDGSDEEHCSGYWTPGDSEENILRNTQDLDLTVLNGTCANQTVFSEMVYNSSTPCENNSTCTDVPGGFTCTCLQGFSGDSCQDTWMNDCEAPCSGSDCERVKTTVDFLLDMNVDPCDDFYAFACKASGRGSNPPPDKEPLVSFKRLVKRPPAGFEYIKNFYKSCTMVGTGWTTEEILFECMEDGVCTEKELQDYGRVFPQFLAYITATVRKALFPAVVPNWEEMTKDWNGGVGWTWWDFAAETLKENYFFGAFHYIRGVVRGGTDHFRAHLFFVPFLEQTVDMDRYSEGDLLPRINIVPMRVPGKIREKDMTWIAKYKGLMQIAFTFMGGSPATVAQDVEKIVEWEMKIGEITEHEYSPDSSWKEVSIKELYALDPYVDWIGYLQKTLSGNSGIKIRRNTKVAIPSEDIIRKMGELVKEMEVNRRDQANLLIWRMIINFANDFMHTGGGDDTDLSDDIFSTIGHTTSRADNCLTQIKTFFPTAEHDMFVAHYISPQEKNTTQQMFQGLKASFSQLIDETSWMTQRTKLFAKQKLQGVSITIGETTPQTPEYEELKARMTSQDYIGNVLAIGNYMWTHQVAGFLDEKKIFSDGNEDENNAFYTPDYNNVIIKTGLINGLFDLGFSLGFPPSLLYGGFVATTLGHELTHGFDTTGRRYDAYGNRRDWWEPSDDREFLNRTSCLEDQYADFTIRHQGRDYSIDKNSRQGENIADNGAAKVAYMSFLSSPASRRDECLPGVPLSPRQLYWLGFALDWCTMGDGYKEYSTYRSMLSRSVSSAGHSPAPWRVNVALSNMPEFAQDFSCPLGSKMNPAPEERCTVW